MATAVSKNPTQQILDVKEALEKMELGLSPKDTAKFKTWISNKANSIITQIGQLTRLNSGQIKAQMRGLVDGFKESTGEFLKQHFTYLKNVDATLQKIDSIRQSTFSFTPTSLSFGPSSFDDPLASFAIDSGAGWVPFLPTCPDPFLYWDSRAPLPTAAPPSLIQGLQFSAFQLHPTDQDKDRGNEAWMMHSKKKIAHAIRPLSDGFPSETCGPYFACKVGSPFPTISRQNLVQDLQAAGYRVVESPKKHDVIAYFEPGILQYWDNQPQFEHIGIISKIDSDGVWVESKWNFGPVYEHRQEVVPWWYGTGVIYLRNDEVSKKLEAQNRPGWCDHSAMLNGKPLFSRFTPDSDNSPIVNSFAPDFKSKWITFAERTLHALEIEWQAKGKEIGICEPEFARLLSKYKADALKKIKGLSEQDQHELQRAIYDFNLQAEKAFKNP